MPNDAVFIPAENSILCESCGYTLDGLPQSGNCPECGQPVARSTTADGRHDPAWEQNASPRSFWQTTSAIILRPAAFYKTLTTRGQVQPALAFAKTHWAISAILVGLALSIHVHWYQSTLLGPRLAPMWLVLPLAVAGVYFFLWGTTRLAARLSAWEAAYRGIRLPLPVVLRAMYYHAAHYLPVSLAGLLTIAGHQLLRATGLITDLAASRYLLVLCIVVIASAGYLFKTYWTGMKNSMYANR